VKDSGVKGRRTPQVKLGIFRPSLVDRAGDARVISAYQHLKKSLPPFFLLFCGLLDQHLGRCLN